MPREAPTAPGTTATELRVLIVDDSLTIRAMVDQIIQREAGCRVVGIAGDVDEAKRMLVDRFPNVITLDLAMPGTGGLDFLDYLTERPHAPVVVVAAGTREGADDTAAALARGAAACFDKSKVVSESSRFVTLLKSVVAAHAAQDGGRPAGA